MFVLGAIAFRPMLNKRYALLGWLTWRIGKRMAARKARAAVTNGDEGRPKKRLIVPALAAAGAALFFWRRHADSSDAGDATTPDSADQ